MRMKTEYRSISMYLTPLESEVSQVRITEKCNEMAEYGWTLCQSNIIDECNIMLIFKRN